MKVENYLLVEVADSLFYPEDEDNRLPQDMGGILPDARSKYRKTLFFIVTTVVTANTQIVRVDRRLSVTFSLFCKYIFYRVNYLLTW